ncbi:hypothetical protein [Parapedobacter soli]|uniref:hypothetical protein n=1 Tax=Parapedobacter soli TaxID=416955 RepID=UPI0021C60088|nr:hypothetical protein [Parapedobacter soli]
MLEKQYTPGGLPIRVEIADGMVRIVSDRPLKQTVVAQPEAATSTLIAEIKADYKVAFGKHIDIQDDSFIVEIWGHLYADYLLLKYSKILRYIFMFGLYARFRRSCETIDCGEYEKDPNRWLWNKLVPFRQLLARRLGNIPSSRFSEG